MSLRDTSQRVRSATDAYGYAGAGMQFAATIGVFGWVGHWLDGKLGTDPFGLAGGVFLGFALGTYSLVSRFSSPTSRASDSDESDPE